MTPKTAELIRELTERKVSGEEIRLALERPLGDDEPDEILALVRWFTRRYPTGADRLAYVRQAYARWRRKLTATS
jgi:hypothetical protein